MLAVLVSADSVPAMSQEHKLVGDLLPCFLGSNTDYILADSLPHKHAKRIFRIIPGLGTSVHSSDDNMTRLRSRAKKQSR